MAQNDPFNRFEDKDRQKNLKTFRSQKLNRVENSDRSIVRRIQQRGLSIESSCQKVDI